MGRRPPSAASGGSLSPTKRSSSRSSVGDLTAAPANGTSAAPAGSPGFRRPKSKPEPAGSGGGSGSGAGGGAGSMEGGAETGGFERDGRFPGAETPLAPTTTAAPSRVLSTEALLAPPAIDRVRRPSEAKPAAAPEQRTEVRPATAAATVPDRTEAKTPATAATEPAAAAAAAAASSAPASKATSATSLLGRAFSKKAAPSAKALPAGSEIRVAAASAKAASGFRVAVKASHPSPRPFAASDLTFD